METSGGAARRVLVRVGPQVWREEVERYHYVGRIERLLNEAGAPASPRQFEARQPLVRAFDAESAPEPLQVAQ